MGRASRARRATRWQKNQRARIHLANEAEQGIATAKLVDPDIEAKDEDIRLLKVRNPPVFVAVTSALELL